MSHMAKRYTVHTVQQSPVGRPVREPYWVIDTTTNESVAEYKSKKAAQMHAKQLNDAEQA
jgi:hypothetical protein